ncbi:CoA-acylating methylmalonate-semialdehyde dehydrogenase [Rhodospirillaceae bacterium KN72]|uniref:methylmalonate-semialdehyde dehydrogenase (CoA acylating) n=1 Tax=Pacificispira spongiicola TaxID=2729598 RepID=A0A7Y0DZJ2_9PROT|nr:CoA-acylating methylmalonate-semialdehyde dehydrogenase [Pacificispira spongiicola]NMM44492.1 CoA-acylating methylmalonate-semialdehyde dehydrogenase [Pacificispira spongiicola]
MVDTIPHFIGGTPVSGTSGRTGDVFNPATGEVVAKVAYASRAEVDAFVKKAVAAHEIWSNTPSPKRASVIFRMRELVVANRDKLAEVLCKEHGKTLPDAQGEIQRGIDVIEFAAGAPHLMKGEFNENIGGGIDLFSVREPVGVVGGITPFNFPVMIPLWMGAMAIACGNAYINKPSERDPSAPMMLAELWKEAGLPDGVWSVVHGDKEAVDALLEHPDVPAISFVGSTPVGEYIYQHGCAHNKRVQAFCGAKNHMVVMPDADIDQAVDALVGAGYGSAGERCMAISVAVPVGEETSKKLIDKLVPRVQALKIGPYNDADAEINPLITRQAKERVEGLIQRGVDEGAKLLVDGRGATMQGYENGFFVGGTLFDQVTTDMEIYKTEIFGPVLSVMAPSGYEDAVQMINDHEYGNGVAIFTRDGDTARDFSKKVDVGMIGVNVPIPVPMAFHNFGGAKRSKFGDTQMHGPESIRFFTKMKTISSRWPSGIKEGAQLAFPTNN